MKKFEKKKKHGKKFKKEKKEKFKKHIGEKFKKGHKKVSFLETGSCLYQIILPLTDKVLLSLSPFLYRKRRNLQRRKRAERRRWRRR